MDRVISGHCECCETFAFNIHRNEGTRIEQLDEVVLNYSSSDRDQLVSTAKRIADAIGMNSADVADIGSTTDQHVTWIKSRNNYRELSSMELRFSRQGQLWHLFINWGRDRLPPLGKSR